MAVQVFTYNKIPLSFLEYEVLYNKIQGVHFICFELTFQLKSNFLVDILGKITSAQSLTLTISGCEGTGGNIDNCCSTTNLCGLSQGNCKSDEHCTYDLICGTDNCGADFPAGTNCCQKPFPCNGTHERTDSCCSSTNLCTANQGNCEGDGDCIGNLRCGKNNCGSNFPKGTNCCYKPPTVGGIFDYIIIIA